MALDMAEVLRLKGTIDAVVAVAPKDPFTATPALVETYVSARQRCLELVTGSDIEVEFRELFPEIENVDRVNSMSDPVLLATTGDRARLLLAKLGGWLGSLPSAEALLSDLITAIEHAEATTEVPEERERLASLLRGLRGAGRQIAIDVIAAYLARQV